MDVSIWVPVATAIIGLFGGYVTHALTAPSNRKRDKAQHESQLKLKQAELTLAARLALSEKRASAFSELLRQIRLAPEVSYREVEAMRAAGKSSLRLYHSELWAASDQVKLLCTESNRLRIDDAMSSFARSYYEAPGPVTTVLMDVMTSELQGDTTVGATAPALLAEHPIDVEQTA